MRTRLEAHGSVGTGYNYLMSLGIETRACSIYPGTCYSVLWDCSCGKICGYTASRRAYRAKFVSARRLIKAYQLGFVTDPSSDHFLCFG